MVSHNVVLSCRARPLLISLFEDTVSTLTGLALHIPIEDLLIPPSAYLCDRRISPDVHAPYVSGQRAFAIKQPLPLSSNGGHRLPRVLREATSFILMDENLKTEGLFRIPPLAVTVDILREAYDRGQKFIMWHERDVAVIFYRSERRQVLSDSMSQTEGYGVHAAAGLIKLWYRELRHPIIPQSSYRQLNDLFGDSEKPIDRTRLVELVSIDSEWSLLTETSRLILTKHLLPLLSRVADFQSWNQMTSYNLATCLAPSMLCGPDPIEDAKMASIVSRVLEAAVANWKTTLAPICHMDYFAFEESVRVPSAVEDYEDPLEEDPASTAMRTSQTESFHAQKYGITLVDNDNDTSDTEDSRPPLPPRPRTRAFEQGEEPGTSVVRRKPAPPPEVPPRYSTIIDRPVDASQLHPFSDGPTTDTPTTAALEAEQRGNNHTHDLPRASTPAIIRKPLPKGSNA